jgi:hypothetical protein
MAVSENYGAKHDPTPRLRIPHEISLKYITENESRSIGLGIPFQLGRKDKYSIFCLQHTHLFYSFQNILVLNLCF